jgi:hypothetical protein
MTNHIGPARYPVKVLPRASMTVFPSQVVDPEYESRVAPIRWAVWCFVFELALSIILILVWRIW